MTLILKFEYEYVHCIIQCKNMQTISYSNINYKVYVKKKHKI